MICMIRRPMRPYGPQRPASFANTTTLLTEGATMKSISRTLIGMFCAIGLGASLPAVAAVTVNISVVTGPTFVHAIAARKFKEEFDKTKHNKNNKKKHNSASLGSETQVLQ